MQNLKTLIELLERGRKIHISILDLGGILNLPITAIDFKNVIHSKRFCRIAKSTESGYRACLRCKMLANKKATVEKCAFSGACSYGLYEAAVPLIIDKSVMAVVYVGNAVVSREESESRLKRTALKTGVPISELTKELEACEFINEPSELFAIAEIVCDYMKLLYDSTPKTKPDLHWLVSLMKRHADKEFCYNVSLKELAATYRKNEKYIGRLFRKEMGISFSEYCMELRLQKAERMLLSRRERIIDIALECGFNNVSYFNRSFQKKYGISPTKYREKTKD